MCYFPVKNKIPLEALRRINTPYLGMGNIYNIYVKLCYTVKIISSTLTKLHVLAILIENVLHLIYLIDRYPSTIRTSEISNRKVIGVEFMYFHTGGVLPPSCFFLRCYSKMKVSWLEL